MAPTSAARRQSAPGVPATKTPHQRRSRLRVPKGSSTLIVTRTKRDSPEAESSESRDDASAIDLSEGGEGSEMGSDDSWRDRSLVDNSPYDKRKTRLSTGDIPNWIDQPEQFNEQVIEASKDYQKIVDLREASWSEEFNLRATDDPDPDIKDYAVDKEVFERSSEGYKKWDEQWLQSGNKSNGFKIDYIVATSRRKLGEMMAVLLLVKYSNYPVPSWEKNKDVFKRRKSFVAEEYSGRLLDLDLIEIRLRAELGDDEFVKTYPNRYLEHETGKGRGGYVMGERARYFNYLRAVEWRMCFVCSRFGIAGLYVEDWTNGPCDGAARLRLFEFVVRLMNSDFVERVVQEHEQLEQVKCATCYQCDQHLVEKGDCCETKINAPSCRSHTASMINFECSKGCRCVRNKCRNRPLQKGRQMVLCIFRHPEKGWSIRCVQEIPHREFVTEYAGEVNLHQTDGKGHNYDFPMQCPMRDENGRRKYNPFTISSHKKGNEARFLNHSCNPNLVPIMTVLERYGCFYHHVAFYAKRMIMAGEELTFNYFPNREEDFDPKHVFRVCKCNSGNCNFTEEKLRVIRDQNGEEETEEEEEVEEIVVVENSEEDEEILRVVKMEEGDGAIDMMMDQEEHHDARVERIQEDGGADNIHQLMIDIFGSMTSDNDMDVAPDAVAAAPEKSPEKEKKREPSTRMKRKSSKMLDVDRDKTEKMEKKEAEGRGRKSVREEKRRKEEEKRKKRGESSSASPELKNRRNAMETRRKKIRSFGLMSEDEKEEKEKTTKKKKKEEEKEGSKTKKMMKKKGKEEVEERKTSRKNVSQEENKWKRRSISPLEVMEGNQSFKNVVRMTVAGGMTPVRLKAGLWTEEIELEDVIRKSNRLSPSTSPSTSDAEKRASSSDRTFRTARGGESSPDPSMYSTRRRFLDRSSSDDQVAGPANYMRRRGMIP